MATATTPPPHRSAPPARAGGVTLRDVAERAGVSLMVASRALGGQLKGLRKDASDRAEHIRRIADELRYRRDLAALATRRRRFGSVALVLSSGDARRSNLPSALLAGISDRLEVADMHLSIARMSDQALTDRRRVPRLLRDLGADGLLVNYNQWVPPAVNQLIQRHAIPAVWINDKRGHDAVYADELDAGRRAALHLLELGHRRVIYLGHPVGSDRHYSERDRRDGCLAALGRAGATRLLIESAQPDERTAELARLLAREDRPTALVAYNLNLASLALIRAVESGLRCPDDLSILTFSGQPVHLGRSVSMLRVPDAEVGTAAVGLLLDRLEQGGRSLPGRAIPHLLEPGQTCAPPSH